MFFRILKKDLKRKKVMNMIVLLFVTMATLFVASSMNNIVTVVTGLDCFFEKADRIQKTEREADSGFIYAVSS